MLQHLLSETPQSRGTQPIKNMKTKQNKDRKVDTTLWARVFGQVCGAVMCTVVLIACEPDASQSLSVKTSTEPSIVSQTGSSSVQTTSAGKSSTLEQVMADGFLKCGVSKGLPGFSNPDANNNWSGIDVDFCRAIAAALFNDPMKVKFTPTSTKERFTALQSGEVDILSRNTTWTLSRDTTLGFNFAGIMYYDGQGFLVNKKKYPQVKTVKDLDGATFCISTGTTTEINLADYYKKEGMTYKMVAYENNDESVKAYEAGRCDVLTTDQSGLYANKLKMKNPDDHVVLPDVIAKEPLGPVVRHGDDQWLDIVKWTLFALFESEELGITKANVDQFKSTTKNPTAKRLLGVDDDIGAKLGLSKMWAYQMIKHVGNYGEIFENNLGESTPLQISRGLNALWKDGGLHYAMPMR